MGNISEEPRPGESLEELLERIDYKRLLEATACSKDPPCTDLLADPVAVLNNEERWPKHFCPGLFQARSTYEWASSLVMATTPEVWQWQETWPLPIGKMALKLDIFSWELYNLMPFEGQEEAMWAIRINVTDGTPALDLFGLGTPYERGGVRVYEMTDLKVRPWRHDAPLFDLITRADRWWAWLHNEKITGRPPGTGTWASADEFKKALSTAVRVLRTKGLGVTQERVADILRCNDSLLRKWIKRYYGPGTRWKELLKTL